MIGCLFWRYRVFDFFFMRWIEQYGKLTSFFLCVCPVSVDKLRPKWRHFRESKINLASREKITQAKFKQLGILYSTNEVIIML